MRLATTMVHDLRLQTRYGFYLVYAVVCVAYIVVLRLIPAAVTDLLLPYVIFTDPAVFGLFFVGALVMLEKADGSLEGLFVTPLSPRTYIAAKVLSLAVLALFTSLAIALSVAPLPHPGWLALGVVLTASVFTLIGIGVAARTTSLNSFLLLAGLSTGGFSLPLLDYFELWQSPLFFALPTQGSLVLLRTSFDAAPPHAGRLAAGIATLAVWLLLTAWWAERRFLRWVVRGGAA